MTCTFGLATRVLHDQDRSLIDPKLGLFGVFDGVGQYQRSGEAAQLASEVIQESCRAQGTDPMAALMTGCARAEGLIRERQLGATTATVAWVRDDRLWFISVGDSRLYLQPDAISRLSQVTTDEGEGPILFNVLGEERPRPGSTIVRQHGQLPIRSGAKLVLVTDGVTGDYPPDLLTVADVASGLRFEVPQRAAESLVAMARKHDDRTALVVFLA
ncbi:MAG TPA: protein phosphatase 2C domain-containing protein [Candidatus Dormibacteraeota bacterium]